MRTKRDLTQLLIVILLLTSAILFAGVKSRQLLGLAIDRIFLRDFTLILFGISIILYFIIHYCEYSRVGTDLKKAQDMALRSLEKEFDKLGG